jgi:TolA-binding protein
MRKLWIWLILVCVAGCVSLNKGQTRKREPVVIEKRESRVRPQFHIPQIRKPRIIRTESKERQINKMDKAVTENKEEEIISTPAQLNKNLNEAERNNRFDDLVELGPKEDQIKEKEHSRVDSWMTWIGAIGVLSVFWTGVYFIAKNLLLK